MRPIEATQKNDSPAFGTSVQMDGSEKSSLRRQLMISSQLVMIAAASPRFWMKSIFAYSRCLCSHNAASGELALLA